MKKMSKYNEILKLFWPIAMAMFLSSILSLIDSIMISNYDVVGISAISVATQIQFLFGPLYFAIMTGVNIYSVQYFARGEYVELKKYAGIALCLLIPLSLINFIAIVLFGDQVISSFVGSNIDAQLHAESYLKYFKYSLLLQPLDMFFMYQYRAIKRPKIPMITGTIQAMLNIFFNYFLIYGHGPFHAHGLAGAAVGTILARLVMVITNIIIVKKINAPFFGSFKEMFGFDMKMLKIVVVNTIPLMVVELGFGIGNLFYAKMYALTGIVGFTAFNIAKSTSFIINALVIATANVSAILVGGAVSKTTDVGEIKKTTKLLFRFMFFCSMLIMTLSVFVLPHITWMFGAGPGYHKLITQLIIVNGIWMSLRVFASSFISILKSGNDNKFVILVDAGSTFIVGIPLTLAIYYIFTPGIVVLRSVIIVESFTKICLGLYRYKKRKWIKQL